MPPIAVEFSDKPEWQPMTVAHLLSAFFIHALFLVIATFVWFGELCFKKKKRTHQAAKTTARMFEAWNN